MVQSGYSLKLIVTAVDSQQISLNWNFT